MRTRTMLALAVGAILGACSQDKPDLGEPPTDGTLTISTATIGDDPDRDGFQLTVDGVTSVTLEPTDSVQVVIPAGRHALGLLGVAGQCSVEPGTPLEVDIAAQGTTPVAFRLNCPAVGAEVTLVTTGLDTDQDGYRVTVDGVDQAPISPNASRFIRAQPGVRAIAVRGLAPNCTTAGPDSLTVTIAPDQVSPVEFAVVCTATAGVIQASLSLSGSEVERTFEVMVDGLPRGQLATGADSAAVLVSGGDHLVDLAAPSQCSVVTAPQSVNVTVGGLIRDTVEVSIAVTCTDSAPWDY